MYGILGTETLNHSIFWITLSVRGHVRKLIELGMKRWLVKFKALLLVPYLREKVVLARIFYFIKIRRRLKTQDSNEAFEVTVKHNLKGLRMCNNRMDFLIKPLSTIETLNKKSKFLVIGPRNENDLFSLLAQGFAWRNIYGLDLITYSDKVWLGDMHDMPFNDNFFDAVLCGWTLSYSSTPQKATKEMVRVVRNKGLIGIGVEYSTMLKEDSERLLGYSIQDYSLLPKRINSSAEILNLFDDKIDHLFFNHDAPNKVSHTRDGRASKVSNVITIFSIKK
jgi:SAM-dependent methyltransferase